MIPAAVVEYSPPFFCQSSDLSKPVETIILALNISPFRNLFMNHVNLHIIRHWAQHSYNTGRYTYCSNNWGRWRDQKHRHRYNPQKHGHQTHNNESASADFLVTNCKRSELFKRKSYIYLLTFTITNRMQQFMNRHQKQSDKNPKRNENRVDRPCSKPLPLYKDY